MPAVAAAHAHPDRTERQVQVVADDDDPLRRDVHLVHPVTDGVAAEVHVCGRLEEDQFPSPVGALGYAAVTPAFENKIGCLGPGIQYHKSHVVPGRSVLSADVSQSDDKIVHTGFNGFPATQQSPEPPCCE